MRARKDARRSRQIPSIFRAIAIILAAGAMISLGLSAANANPKYSGIVIDAKTGKTLYASSADAQRYPASLTKMMTLYLIFDAIEAGKMSKSTLIPFSANAASKPPSKLGVKVGRSITAEQAIYALVTRSANDVATAVAEYIGGSEGNFARLMTAKAQQLGMKSTVFRNANGLPDPRQHTTARDMARLGMALRDRHPKYFQYFSTRSFTYNGSRIGNHNHLLGKVKGVDGIKTGYIRASGFNLVTSVSTGGREIVAVVFGGKTARSRDAHMVELVNTYLPKASTGSDRFLVAEKGGAAAIAALLPQQVPLPAQRPQAGPADTAITAYAEEADIAQGDAPLVEAVRPSAAIDPVRTASTAPGGWVIQVASTPSEAGAKAILSRTASKAPTLLADASPFTETVTVKGTTYFRARFGGFGSKSEAWSACSNLKKRDIPCYAVQQ